MEARVRGGGGVVHADAEGPEADLRRPRRGGARMRRLAVLFVAACAIAALPSFVWHRDPGGVPDGFRPTGGIEQDLGFDPPPPHRVWTPRPARRKRPTPAPDAPTPAPDPPVDPPTAADPTPATPAPTPAPATPAPTEWDGGQSPDDRILKIFEIEERRKRDLARLGLTPRRLRPAYTPPQPAPKRDPAPPAQPHGGHRSVGDGATLRRLGLSGKQWKPRRPAHCLPHRDWRPAEEDREKFSKAADGSWRIDDPELRRQCGSAEPERAAAVVDAMKDAWGAYRRDAWGHDELAPLSAGFKDWAPGGVGLTLVDSMDTLWLMGLREEFNEAAWWVEESLDLLKDAHMSVFELSIRVIGGLLSAYTMSADEALLAAARRAADALLPAFETPSGIPVSLFNPLTRTSKYYGWTRDHALLAEAGTLQMEWRLLSWLTGNETYDRVVTKAMDVFAAAPRPRGYRDGLLPIFIDVKSGTMSTNLYSVGGMGDSFYEYLLKQWLQAGNGMHAKARVDRAAVQDKRAARDARATYKRYSGMWNSSMYGIRRWLVGRAGGKYFVGQRVGSVHRHRMDHLSCFLPGLFALSVHAQGDEATNDPKMGWGGRGTALQLAESIMATCIEMYDTPTGLPPEDVLVLEGRVVPAHKFYLLRPETIESLFYLWRVTRKQRYRDVGWRFFRALMQHCRTPRGGFHGLESVYDSPTEAKDQMESFFTAETLKYFYLLFSDDGALPLDEWVFNTEGHPLPVVPEPRPSMSVYQDVAEADADE
eukprot:TRINITY_DN18759_c0_g1_i1.p1 TRINITY_DN18759_c0_g1~~TRINITY_DN18759_c0_g1_i1.p1  ORF type:complete len:775 (+),score=234.79 TRINITY_DN18759_c0_g1_i1:39-2327(+)